MQHFTLPAQPQAHEQGWNWSAHQVWLRPAFKQPSDQRRVAEHSRETSAQGLPGRKRRLRVALLYPALLKFSSRKARCLHMQLLCATVP